MMRPDGFLATLRAAGLMLDAVVADGHLRRVRAEGDASGQRSGWYVLHAGPPQAGMRWWCRAASPMATMLDRIRK